MFALVVYSLHTSSAFALLSSSSLLCALHLHAPCSCVLLASPSIGSMASVGRPAKRVRLDPSTILPADIDCVLHRDIRRLRDISIGSSSVVFMARHRRTDEIVALKRLTHHCRRGEVQHRTKSASSQEDERWRTEVDCLASCRHPNVVRFQELARDASGSDVFLVMEYGHTDLGKLLRERSRPFLEGEVKWLMSQLLRGVNCIHEGRILHGDLKPSHVLVDYHGDLKICGFGRCRRWGSDDQVTGATMCYMAPELLLAGPKKVEEKEKKNKRKKEEEECSAGSMDMWSVGCIMAELLSQKALFQVELEGQGKSSKRATRDQIKKIIQVLGTPDEDMWPGVSRIPEAVQVMESSNLGCTNILRRLFPAAANPWFPSCPALSPEGYDLLSALLKYDPRKRPTVGAALDHPWFRRSSTTPPAVQPQDVVFRAR